MANTGAVLMELHNTVGWWAVAGGFALLAVELALIIWLFRRLIP